MDQKKQMVMEREIKQMHKEIIQLQRAKRRNEVLEHLRK